MKYKNYLIINLLIAAFSVALIVMFSLLLDINKPVGLILFIVMGLISISSLVFYTIYLLRKPTVPAGFILISAATYAMQLTPFIIFALASDYFIRGALMILPISLIFVFVIAYLIIMFAFTYFNMVAHKADAKLVGRTREPECEDNYTNVDGSFKGSK